MRPSTMNNLFRDLGFIVLACICFLQNNQAQAQAEKLRVYGAPLLQRYTAKDYSGNPQHSTIATDKSGRLYVGNNEGILRFDGTTWELIELPGRQNVRDLVRANDGKIYVASFDTFGELVTDQSGKTTFVELMTLSGLQGKDRHVGNVWEVVYTDLGVYFRAEENLFFISYDRNTRQQWPMSEDMRSVFPQVNILYGRVNGLGFCRFDNGKFILQPGGEVFANQPLAGMIDMGSWRLLVSDEGFYRADQNGIKRLPNNAGAELKSSGAYEVLSLSDGSFVVGTKQGDVFRFGKDFTVLERLKLGSYSIAAISADNEGGL